MILTKQKVIIEQMTPVYDAYRLIEKIGRVCYKSEERITPSSSTKFIENLIARNHLSVIEHCIVSVRFIVNRGVSHELVRHRLASFSQESSRYCNYANKEHVEFIIPHWLDLPEGTYHSPIINSDDAVVAFTQGLIHSERIYKRLIEAGKKPEDARDILPIDLKTELVMTANLREWLLVCQLRTDKAAHPNMRQVMGIVYNKLQQEYPEIFKKEKKND